MRNRRIVVLVFILILMTSALLLVACKRGESAGDACAEGHAFGQQVVIEHASCDKNGSARRTCSACDREEIIELPALGHNESDWITDVEPSCTAPGESHTECTVCGLEMDQRTESILGHVAGEAIVDIEPTCMSEGASHTPCARCGETVATSVLDRAAHTAGGRQVIIVAPTHTQKGQAHEMCAVCDKYVRTVWLEPVQGHVYEWRATTPPTCTQTGFEKQYCTVEGCGHIGVGREAAVAPHTPGEWEIIGEATCTGNRVKRQNCAVCGTVMYETEELAGHTPGEWVVVSEPSCTLPGSSKQRCAVCGVTMQTREEQPTGHSESDWIVDLAPNCTEEGRHYKVCTVCHATTVTAPIPATGHTVGEWIVDVEPTCTTEGRRHAGACSACGAVTVEEILPALGHERSEWTALHVALCTSGGTSERRCARCHTVTDTRVDNPLGHDEGEWVELSSDASRITQCCTRCSVTLHTYNKEEYARESGEHQVIDLTGYVLVYDADASVALSQKVGLLAERLGALTGTVIYAYESVSPTTKAIEILVGEDADINGYGFAIKRAEGKIVIAGTNALTVQMGIDYFMNTYLKSASISLPALAVSDDYEMITLSAGGVSSFVTIYDVNLDTQSQADDVKSPQDPDTFYGNSSETGRDYAYDAALKIATQIGAKTRADSTNVWASEVLVGRTNREQTAAALSRLRGHEYGIMVIDGRVVITGYSTAAIHKAAPLFCEYLSDATLENGRILLPRNLCMIGEVSDRWLTDAELLPNHLPLSSTADDGDGAHQYLYTGNGVNAAAFDAYVTALKNQGYVVLTENNAEGSRFVTLTDADRTQMLHVAYNAFAHANDNVAGKEWKYSTPSIRVTTAYVSEVYVRLADVLPSGYKTHKTYKAYESGIQLVHYLYNSKPNLDSYRDKLTKKGFRIVLKDVAGERYILVKDSTNEVLEMSYSNKAITVNAGTESQKTYTHSIKVRYRAPGVITLPDDTLLNPNQTYQKVTDTKVVSIDLSAVVSKGVSGNYGTGYVIQLEDGRFVMIDGGGADGGTSNSSTAWAQVDNCYSILSALYRDTYGVDPTPENPIHIAAWIITHGHGDHMCMFWDFANRYGGGGGSTLGAYVKLDYIFANTPDYTTMYNTGEPNMSVQQEMTKWNNYIVNGFDYIKMQTGQKYYLANLEIETLFTHGDLNPQRLVTFNDSSAIQRLSFLRTADERGERAVNHATASAASKTSFLSTGDAYRWGGRWMAAMFGDYLACDMVSVSHHGGPGFTKEIYDLVSAKVLWWSMGKNAVYNSYLKNRSWFQVVDQHAVFGVAATNYVYVADDYHITLVLKAAGPDYNGIYHATDASKTPLTYYTENLTAKPSSSHNFFIAKSVAYRKVAE